MCINYMYKYEYFPIECRQIVTRLIFNICII